MSAGPICKECGLASFTEKRNDGRGLICRRCHVESEPVEQPAKAKRKAARK